MTKEEKSLLIKDLCARLPYRINILTEDNDKGHIIGVDDTENGVFVIHIIEDGDSYTCDESIENFKPYLRPMSSMTKKEFDEYMRFIKHSWEGIDKEEDDYYVKVKDRDIYTDWLLSHHFDYRGLIPLRLALEAPKDMYKTE